MGYPSPSFSSPYFTLEQVADGLYVALARAGTGARANAGIVDLGEQTLVFDTFSTPQAAASLRQAAEHLTGRPVKYVINSHHHMDHVFGNQVFEGATIFASDTTYNLMRTSGAERVERLRANPLPFEQLEGELAYETDPAIQRDGSLYIRELRAVHEALPTLQFRLPDVTFERRLAFAGSKHSAVLLTFGGGHSPSDSLFYFPDLALAFVGDLVQTGHHPALNDGNPAEWMQILTRLDMLQLTALIPGHGTVGTGQDIHVMLQYFNDLQQLVAQAIAANITLEQLLSIAIPGPYAAWQAAPDFKENLQYLYAWQQQIRATSEQENPT
ncbi:MBL fold metallo-hydrolase [Dictyobacter arantiisoli]|uniref:Metallo-beta-lactamase domain-containing protein n=1 Tax=Dictyobacter arantiisoli TaxID=2014874 RepID=A0A5A5TBF0_9CHLR|nr:MBL fold metallo-hydrolase [Dictyobacter arantiisoli]GCF08343.1 hypothetical protein KDI_19070 [Dictyobacter arantiisoli]